MTSLPQCQWTPRWVSHMGCLKGCLDFLGIEISDAWLYGGTGHAFVINVHEEVCPSGPTAWMTGGLFELGPNLGYKVDGVFGSSHQEDFIDLQTRAFEHVCQAIDRGWPCYGWELEIPEFYVVYGYEPSDPELGGGGYYFSGPGCEAGKGPKPWQTLGDTDIGILEIYSVAPCEATDDATTVRQALSFALKHASNPQDWIFEHYRAGLEGFEAWINALQQGSASDMGVRYNAGVWLECRRNAASFLAEAGSRLAGHADALFEAAYTHYTMVAKSLAQVTAIYPWDWETSDEVVLPVDERSSEAVAALQAAQDAEASGLETLDRIVQTL